MTFLPSKAVWQLGHQRHDVPTCQRALWVQVGFLGGFGRKQNSQWLCWASNDCSKERQTLNLAVATNEQRDPRDHGRVVDCCSVASVCACSGSLVILINTWGLQLVWNWHIWDLGSLWKRFSLACIASRGHLQCKRWWIPGLGPSWLAAINWLCIVLLACGEACGVGGLCSSAKTSSESQNGEWYKTSHSTNLHH